MKTLFGLAAVLSVSLLGGSASAFPAAPVAFPAAPVAQVAVPVEQVRLVCNEWGRCWQTGPRYYRYGYYGPRRYYGPGYGYGYGGPYGYYGGPGVAVGVPGFGFRFGF